MRRESFSASRVPQRLVSSSLSVVSTVLLKCGNYAQCVSAGAPGSWQSTSPLSLNTSLPKFSSWPVTLPAITRSNVLCRVTCNSLSETTRSRSSSSVMSSSARVVSFLSSTPNSYRTSRARRRKMHLRRSNLLSSLCLRPFVYFICIF